MQQPQQQSQQQSQQESNRQIISVSELTRHARDLLENEFPMLYVEGEISNLAQPNSGHWYFTLKDDRAQIRCAMFRNRNQLIRFRPADGQQVIVQGRISLYEARGEFQMIAEFLEEAGDGALRRAFEKLKATLQAEGLFDEAAKKPLPALPRHLAIITSPTGAAIQDVLTVMSRRFPALHASVIPVQVQGEDSAPQIVKAIQLANGYKADPFDLILLTRGGGSLEDLWSFNTEPVARAIAESELPVVSAVGHESDISIADLTADLRAPTPSAAAELVTPDGRAWWNDLEEKKAGLVNRITNLLGYHDREVTHLRARLRHPERHLKDNRSRLDALVRQLQLMETQLRSARQARLSLAAEKLNALSPLGTLQRGYAIVLNVDQQVVTDADSLAPGDEITARLKAGEVRASVLDTEGMG